jgi:cytosine/adenosine deaminase-related metal-dependent hydrolase
MPDAGWVNAHTHLYSGLAPLGMPAPEPNPESFTQILERVWWRLDRALDERALRASAELYVGEALVAGTTGLVDHHESPELIEGSLDVLADVCQDLGMRAVLCYGATERNGGRDEARRGLAECARFARENDRQLVAGVVGLHAPFTVSDDTLREAGELARELETVVHVHVAEDPVDVADAEQRGYEGVVDRLVRNDALPAGSILAHGVHLTEEEVKTCSERGWWLVQNPRSNQGNGVGYPAALGASDRVALGTDGYPSELLDEGEALLVQALANGEEIRRAAPRIDAGHRLLAERLPGGPEVKVRPGTTLVDGAAVVHDGELARASLTEIRERAQDEANRLWERMGSQAEGQREE